MAKSHFTHCHFSDPAPQKIPPQDPASSRLTFESFVSYVPNFLNALVMHSGGVSELGDLVGDL